MDSAEAFPVCFSDLKPEVQKQLLGFMGIDDPADLNWDVLTVAEVSRQRILEVRE